MPTFLETAIAGLLLRKGWETRGDREMMTRFVSHQFAVCGWPKCETQRFFATLSAICDGPAAFDPSEAVSSGYVDVEAGQIAWNEDALVALIGWDGAGALSRWAFDRRCPEFRDQMKKQEKRRGTLNRDRLPTLAQTAGTVLSEFLTYYKPLDSGTDDPTANQGWGWNLTVGPRTAEQIVRRACAEFLFVHSLDGDPYSNYATNHQELCAQDADLVASLADEMMDHCARTDLRWLWSRSSVAA